MPCLEPWPTTSGARCAAGELLDARASPGKHRVTETAWSTARSGAAAAALLLVAGAMLGALLPLTKFEPLFAFDAGAERLRCLRAHWAQEVAETNFYHHVALLEVGVPTRAATLLTRFDVDAATGLADALGVSAVDATALVQAALDRSTFEFLVVLQPSELLASSVHPYTVQSDTMTDCARPVAAAQAVVCTETIKLITGSPNRLLSPNIEELRVGVVLTPLLSDAAQLHLTNGELYLYTGAAGAPTAATLGATTVCEATGVGTSFRGGEGGEGGGGGGGEVRTLHAAWSGGAGLVGNTSARCGAGATRLFGVDTSHPRLLLGERGVGFDAATAFDAACCANGGAQSPAAFVACGVAEQSSTCTRTADQYAPLADVARRARASTLTAPGAPPCACRRASRRSTRSSPSCSSRCGASRPSAW